MTDFPDVLDHLGKTPREFGAVHVHVEPVTRGEDGKSIATVWCQAAFAPVAGEATIEVLAHKSTLPPLGGGLVMRGQLPLEIPADTHKLLFVVNSTLHEKAERVRPAWKLFDTWEMPREDRGGGGDAMLGSFAGAAMLNVVALPLGYVAVPRTLGLGALAADTARSTVMKVTKANELPPGFLAEVVRGTPEALAAPAWTEVWRPGQELPKVALPVWGGVSAPPVAQTGPRVCSKCDFSGKRADFGTDRFCPSCGHEWD